MKMGLLFWVLMLVWLVFGLVSHWPANNGPVVAYGPLGGSLLLFIVVSILGWKVFGPPLQE